MSPFFKLQENGSFRSLLFVQSKFSFEDSLLSAAPFTANEKSEKKKKEKKNFANEKNKQLNKKIPEKSIEQREKEWQDEMREKKVLGKKEKHSTQKRKKLVSTFSRDHFCEFCSKELERELVQNLFFGFASNKKNGTVSCFYGNYNWREKCWGNCF